MEGSKSQEIWFNVGTLIVKLFFREVVNDTCCTSSCNLLMTIPEHRNLNMDRIHGNAMVNTLFKNHSYLYSPHSEKKTRQKILELSAN